jgi:glycerol-3-phosphate dehydrogenase
MKDITIIGLGVMGTALARTLLENGYSVTVWNRTPVKSAVLEAEGARIAATCVDAVAASSTVANSTQHDYQPMERIPMFKRTRELGGYAVNRLYFEKNWAIV